MRCLSCGYLFKGPLPEWMTTQLCDRCFSNAMRYITASSTPAQTHARLRAIHRLYATPQSPSSEQVPDPCSEDVPTTDAEDPMEDVMIWRGSNIPPDDLLDYNQGAPHA